MILTPYLTLVLIGFTTFAVVLGIVSGRNALDNHRQRRAKAADRTHERAENRTARAKARAA